MMWQLNRSLDGIYIDLTAMSYPVILNYARVIHVSFATSRTPGTWFYFLVICRHLTHQTHSRTAVSSCDRCAKPAASYQTIVEAIDARCMHASVLSSQSLC